jgi:membrane-bound inhibitor of C-type lysozyme
MSKRVFRGGAILGTALALIPLLLVASCVSEGQAGGAKATATETTTQPSHATYSCGPRGALTVDNFRTSVKLVDPEGETVDLPASPATQQSRYGETPYALVLDGNEALYMKSGKEPVTCRR